MANVSLYLLHYNNYYNRRVKREDTIRSYSPYVIGAPIHGVNFNPNDYINTEQIVNWNDEDPDYMVVVDSGIIDSRWFVVSTSRTRAGQLKLELHRDLVADYKDNIMKAPAFVEKALPKSIRDPAIYHTEDMTFNQIKTREQFLYDKTNCPWIVGYVPRDSFPNDTPIKVTTQLSGAAAVEVENINDWQYYKYKDQVISGELVNPTIRVQVWWWAQIWNEQSQSYGINNIYTQNYILMDQNGRYIGQEQEVYSRRGSWDLKEVDSDAYYIQQQYPSGTPIASYNVSNFTDAMAREIVRNMTTLSSDFKNLTGYLPANSTPEADYKALTSLNGELVHETSTGLYYRVNVVSVQGEDAANEIAYSSALGQSMNSAMVKSVSGKTVQGPYNNTKSTRSPFTFTSPTQYKMLKLEPEYMEITTTIPNRDRRYHTAQSPYDIFCMPYSDYTTIYTNGSTYIPHTNKNAALSIAQSIVAQVGQGNIYDVQLLPYCPAQYILENNKIDISGKQYSTITNPSGEVVNIMFWATSDNVSFQIPVNIPEEQSIIEKKVKNETEFIRICSPNLANFFEFKPQMNEGLEYINVLCHFKPFNPYIKIQPQFKGLYGNSFNDARGLICNGDFSLARVTSAWEDYELQNKNYNNMFDRQMQNLTISQNVQRSQQIAQGIAGMFGAGVNTGIAGGMAGGPVGAAVGAIGGLAASGIGMGLDLHYGDILRNETLDYKRDMYKMSLQNIQALPQGLSKTSAIAPDNRLVPFIEYYTCTSEEKNALRNKIAYNGCTINMIGTVEDYATSTESYVKAKLIRLEDIKEDYHILKAIADEMDKGVFITDVEKDLYVVDINDEYLETGDKRYDLTGDNFTPKNPPDGATGVLKSGQLCVIYEQWDSEEMTGYYIVIK